MADAMLDDSEGGSFPIERLAVIDPTGWQDKPVPERRWLLRDWIPFGATTALYGDGGTGKSLLALQFIASVALGKPFLGLDVTRCKSIGVFCEDDRDELQRRLAAITGSLGIDFADLENVRLISRVGDDNLLATFRPDGTCEPTAFYEQLTRTAREFGAQLVVIDTAADVFGGNENIRPQVRQFLALLTRLAMAIDGVVLLLAHPSQTGKASGTGEGGSTAWQNSVRSRLYLRRPEPQKNRPDDPDQRILSRVKANYSRAGDGISLRWRDGCFVPDEGAGDYTQLARRAIVEDAFIAGLATLNAKGHRSNIHKGQSNYAPKAIAELTKEGEGFSEMELATAMRALIKADRIASVRDGAPSRHRSRLILVEPPLPNLTPPGPAEPPRDDAPPRRRPRRKPKA